MKITLDHPDAKCGYPVIVDDDGNVMPEHVGIAAVLKKSGISHAAFAAFCGILPTTLARYGRQSKAPGHVLNALGQVLKTKGSVAFAAKPKPLSKTERDIANLRIRGKTFTEISRTMGISRQRAHQIAQAAMGKMSLEKDA